LRSPGYTRNRSSKRRPGPAGKDQKETKGGKRGRDGEKRAARIKRLPVLLIHCTMKINSRGKVLTKLSPAARGRGRPGAGNEKTSEGKKFGDGTLLQG